MRTDFLYLKEELGKDQQISDLIEQLKRRTLSNRFPVEFIPTINSQKQLTNIQHFSEIIEDLRDELNQVVVIGLGFVGLTFSLCLSSLGFDLIGIERSTKVREDLKKGQLHILEPGALEILRNNLGKNLRVFSEIEFTKVERTAFLSNVVPPFPSGIVYIDLIASPVKSIAALALVSKSTLASGENIVLNK